MHQKLWRNSALGSVPDADKTVENMARQARKKSTLGIYHVMLRGINKQDIFFCEDDFVRMISILRDIQYKINKYTDEIISSNQCTIYAYCILHNHLHILIKEGDKSLPDIMKIIEDRYAIYYNKKYERIGHLFQSRYPSEPVNDAAYFHTVFRYIARNPVKALEAKTAAEYPYSSWNEYVEHNSNIMKIIKPSAIEAVNKKFPLKELNEWINVDNQDNCLDMDSFNYVKSDKEAWEILSDSCGIDNPEDFRNLDPQFQIYYLLDAIKHGVNIAQASRLGTITRYQLTKLASKKVWRNSASGFPLPENVALARKTGEPERVKRRLKTERGKEAIEDPNADESVEKVAGTDEKLAYIQQQIRCINGMRKNTYLLFHKIAEFLYSHPSSKCQDVADYLNISTEQTRKYLVHLANEKILIIKGKSKSTTYSLIL